MSGILKNFGMEMTLSRVVHMNSIMALFTKAHGLKKVFVMAADFKYGKMVQNLKATGVMTWLTVEAG